MGLIGCVFPALARPSVLTLVPPELFVARPALWLRALSRHRGTISPAPNFAYALATERIRDEELEGVDLSRWRVALNGAEPVAPEVLRAFVERFARWGFRAEALTPVYGLSEAALAVTFSDLARASRSARRGASTAARRSPTAAAAVRAHVAERPSSSSRVGPAAAGLRARAARRARRRGRPQDRVGRVFVRGPSLMRGYLDQPEATAAALGDGWLDTGDLGFLHDGELYLTGRAKEILLVRGRNYAPADVEHAVARPRRRAPGLRRRGEPPAAGPRDRGASCCSSSTAKGVPPARSRALARGRARSGPGAHRSRGRTRWRCSRPGTLPRTSSGKIRRGETLQRYLPATLTPPVAGRSAAPGHAWRARAWKLASGAGEEAAR